MVRISPFVVTLLCALLFLTDLKTSIEAQSLHESGTSSSLVVFPEDENLSDQSAPRPSYTKPNRGRRVPPPIQHPNGRYPHPIDSFLQSIEPFFNGEPPNSFFNPNSEPHLHQHHHLQGGNFYQLSGAPPPLPPPPQFTQLVPRPVKRPPPKNPIKFPSDHQPPSLNGVNHFNKPHNNHRPPPVHQFHHKHPFKPRPTVQQQTGYHFFELIRLLILSVFFYCSVAENLCPNGGVA